MDKKPYLSIKSEVLTKLEANLPVLRAKYGIVTIGIFGSVSRGEDIPESDVDVLYTFKGESVGMEVFLDLADYLEDLFGRKVELVSAKWLSPYLRPYVENDVILYGADKGIA